MINKLRKRIRIVNMVILISVLIAVLLGIYILMYNSEVRQSESVMKTAMDMDSDMEDKQDRPPDGFDKPQHPDFGFRWNDDSNKKDNFKNVGDYDIENTAEEETSSENFSDSSKPDLKRFDDSMLSDTILIRLTLDKTISDIQYQYWEGNEEDTDFAEKAVSLIFKQKKSSGKVKIGNIKIRYMYMKTPEEYKLVLLNRANELSTLNRLLVILVIIGCAVSGVFMVFSIFLANWVVKPVVVAWEKQKQFVADASHELKTPLTVIAANTDVVLSNQDDLVANQTKWLRYIKDETERMTKLVTNLLSLAKADSRSSNTNAEHKKINLSHLVSGVCLVFEPLVFESGKTLNANILNDIEYVGMEDEIKQLVTILIDNALKHSGKKAVIDVLLRRENKKILLEISNTESSIPKEQTERVFERFYRIDESRNRNTGGSGLGLNIAQTIVNNHKGSIKAKSYENMTVFSVIL